MERRERPWYDFTQAAPCASLTNPADGAQPGHRGVVPRELRRHAGRQRRASGRAASRRSAPRQVRHVSHDDDARLAAALRISCARRPPRARP